MKSLKRGSRTIAHFIWLLLNSLIFVKPVNLELKTSNSDLHETPFDMAHGFMCQKK